MTDPLFYVVARKCWNEPLIDAFLFGEYVRGSEASRGFDARPDAHIAKMNKNIAVMPRIFGDYALVITKELREKIEATVEMDWRPVVIEQPFDFEWGDKDGFDVFEEYQRLCMENCLASGKDEHECEMQVKTDDGLAYLDFVEDFKISDYLPATDYFEMTIKSSTYEINNGSFDDVVAMDRDRDPIKFVPATSDWSSWFSLGLLEQHKILNIGSNTYAVLPELFGLMRGDFEHEYYAVHEISSEQYPL